jgi:hypothetical protein
VGATWKLRAIVYGSLLVIGVLVLAARPGDPSPSGPRLHNLRGTTAQGHPLSVGIQDGHLRNVWVSEIKPACGGTVWWHPAVGLRNVEYHQTGNRIDLYQRWTDAIGAFHARVTDGGRKFEGTIYWTLTRCRRSDPIRFSAAG